jgi:hypothetical protein
LTNTLNLDSTETKSLNFMRKLKKRKDLRVQAAFLITIAMKLAVIKKRLPTKENNKEKLLHVIQFKKHLSNFRFALR